MNQKWNKLLNTKTEKEEIEEIKSIKNYISNTNGSFSITGIKNNHIIDIKTQNTEIEQIESFIINVKWSENEFKSKKWKPINNSNVFVFYRE